MTERSDEVVGKFPCPKCGSSNNLVRYADGHAHCYGATCDYWEPAAGGVNRKQAHHATGDLLEPRQVSDLKARRLHAETLKKYGYFPSTFNGKPVQVAPVFKDGRMVAQKLRWANKDFTVLKGEGTETPGMAKCDLWGRHVYGDRFDKKVIVTEGEIDAMSIAQCLDFKVPVVSVTAGSQGAEKNVQANYLWLDRFGEIILWFDDDGPGRAAAEVCAPLFKVGKVKIARVEGFKDANEALKAGKVAEIVEASWSARAWRPRGIVNASECIDDVRSPELLTGMAYPWPILNQMLRGIRRGEVVYHIAGTGVGKTSILNEIAYHCVTSPADARTGELMEPIKVGHMGFEETRAEAQLGIMGLAVNKRLTLDPLPEDEMVSLHKKVFGSGMWELFDPETAEWNVEAIFGYVRYMVKALGCGLITIDPLSFIAAGMDWADERIGLDRTARELAAMSHELGVALHIAHHLNTPEGVAHEEGGEISLKHIRGSRALAHFAMAVVGYERNQQGADPTLTLIKVLKARKTSLTGPADTVRYNLETGRYEQTRDKYQPPKKRGAGSRVEGGFGRIDNADFV